MARPHAVPITLISLILFAAMPAHGWVKDGVPVAVVPNWQSFPVAATDGAGGIIMAWIDTRNGGQDVYAQRLDRDGNALWTANGIPICTAADNQWTPNIVPDGSGGAIIAWEDDRFGFLNTDIYAQRIDAAGNTIWANDGVLVCNAANKQQRPRMHIDGAVIVMSWQDARGADRDIYVYRLGLDGLPVWAANGTALCTSVGEQTEPYITTDGAGGAIVVWEDVRFGNTDVFARLVNFFGTPQWTNQGVGVAVAAGSQNSARIISDGAGGAIMVWQDYRNGAFSDIYAQRLNFAGSAVWTSNGHVICDATDSQYLPDLVPDDAGGTIFAWADSRSGSNLDIYAQHVTSLGSALWPDNGIGLSTGTGNQTLPHAVADGSGGAIIAWYDQRVPGADIYAQRVDGYGFTYWGANGMPVTTAPGVQQISALVATGGGTIAAWQDDRGGDIGDIYAQRIEERRGYWGRPEADIDRVSDNPDDQGGKVALDWLASERDVLTLQEISHYSIWRAVRAVPGSTGEKGSALDVSLEEVGPDFEGPARRAASDLKADYFWEYVSTQAALLTAAYSALVPTRQDSVGGDPAVHYFQVVTHTFDPLIYFPSAPDSGFSVDNLAPAAPLMLAAMRAGGAVVDLDWTASGENEPDFGEYRVYRSDTPGVPTDPAHFLLSSPDTIATDTSADQTKGWYYRVVSVDVHGNPSDDSNEASVNPVATGIDDRTPALSELTLLPNMPNPFGASTELRFGLPEASDVTLSVYDVAGRRVFRQELPRTGAGWQSVTFDGRDGAGRLLPSGVYFYRITAGGATTTRKMVIQR